MTNATANQEHLFDLLSDFKTAMLVTNGDASAMHARPMAVVELERDGDAYFMTSIASPKVGEIERDDNVLLIFQSGSQFASVRGNAHVVRNKALINEKWKEAWKVWFPKGVDDPSLCLIRFEAKDGEYWDNAGINGVRYVFAAIKAYVEGEPPAIDEDLHAKVAL